MCSCEMQVYLYVEASIVDIWGEQSLFVFSIFNTLARAWAIEILVSS